MVNKLYVLILIIYIGFINTLVMSSSWDFAVTTNGKILFYDSNWNQTTAAAHQFNHLSAIAFDEIDELLYFNDQKEKDGTIYSVTLSDKSINHQIETILEKTKDEKIEGLAYDPLDRILYWTDSNNKMIYQLNINNNNDNNYNNNNNNNNNNNDTNNKNVKIFKKLNDNEFPSGISIDICRRRIYWTNINEDGATIEWASLLKGNNESKIIIHEKLYRPYGIVVDQYSARIYWVDNKEGIHYSVESATLDGTDRQLLLYHYNSEPFNLAVDKYYVYFTDNSGNRIWKILKNATDNYSPERIVDHSASLRGIVTRTHLLSTQESNSACTLVIEKIKTSIKLYSSSSSLSSNTSSMTTALKSSANTVIIDKWNTSIRIDDNNSIDKLQDKKSVILILCLNNGTFNERSGRCICAKEFKGIYCEIPKCHNYCIHGTCSISTTGYEECNCNVGYVGDHCEINKCTGFCLNDGHCNYEDNQPVCQCTQKYFGRHCEMNIDICTEFCEKIVSIDIETKLNLPDGCNCNEYNTNNVNNNIYKIDKNENDNNNNNNNDNYNHNNNNNNYDNNNNKFNNNNNNKSATLLQILEDNTSKSSCINNTSINRTAIFVSCGVAVSLLFVYLIIKSARQIYKPLRPRIKKTYVVRKNVNPTPLTSRPSTEQCEITIENCCNMNYCDTPCFDPQKLQEEMSKNQSRKEDKKMLLDNIEGELY